MADVDLLVKFEAEPPPFEVHLIVLVKEDFEPNEFDASLNVMLDAWEAEIDSAAFSLARPPMILPESEMSRGLDRASTKMDLDWSCGLGEP